MSDEPIVSDDNYAMARLLGDIWRGLAHEEELTNEMKIDLFALIRLIEADNKDNQEIVTHTREFVFSLGDGRRLRLTMRAELFDFKDGGE
ncbi:MAG: hypothetical protein SFZ02_19275 [bacterium]|nr:hypothetical protein [bacterium]